MVYILNLHIVWFTEVDEIDREYVRYLEITGLIQAKKGGSNQGKINQFGTMNSTSENG